MSAQGVWSASCTNALCRQGPLRWLAADEGLPVAPGHVTIGMLTTTPGSSIVSSPRDRASPTSSDDSSTPADPSAFQVTRASFLRGL